MKIKNRPPIDIRPRNWTWPVCAAAIFWAVLWGGLIRHLQIEWSVNPQYSYGWLSPWLLLALIWERYKDCPPFQPQPTRTGKRLLYAGLLLAWLPARLIQEANPDWRLIGWFHAVWVVTITLLLIGLAGGRSCRRHFLPAVSLIFLAVPWPGFLENAFVQNLMRMVAGITVEMLNLAGILALQRGSLIELAQGVVGVDEACSGVRSLQAALLVAYFFGEWRRLPWGRRLALLGAGCAAAILLNTFRTLLLALAVVRYGGDSLEQWHDPAGYSILALVFATLWFVSIRMAGTSKSSATPTSLPGLSEPCGRLRRWHAFGLAWLVATAALNEAWYRLHEGSVRKQTQWTIQCGADGPPCESVPIPDDIRSALRFTSGKAMAIRPESGSHWMAYYFEWNPGKLAAHLARIHSPEVCLPAGGYRLEGEPEAVAVAVGSLQLPFRTYLFRSRAKKAHVFFCLWRDALHDGGLDPLNLAPDRVSRLLATWYGRRHSGHRVLEIIIQGPRNRIAAREEFIRHLPALIQTRQP